MNSPPIDPRFAPSPVFDQSMTDLQTITATYDEPSRLVTVTMVVQELTWILTAASLHNYDSEDKLKPKPVDPTDPYASMAELSNFEAKEYHWLQRDRITYMEGQIRLAMGGYSKSDGLSKIESVKSDRGFRKYKIAMDDKDRDEAKAKEAKTFADHAVITGTKPLNKLDVAAMETKLMTGEKSGGLTWDEAMSLMLTLNQERAALAKAEARIAAAKQALGG
jgi:hypothetical protein